MSFGDRLKEARETRGVALDAIASATRIAPRYLDALERSDLRALPGGPFGKGYMRAYAQYLGIDPQPILDAYDIQERREGRGTPESEQQMLRELSQLVNERAERSRGKNRVLVSLGGRRRALVLMTARFLAAGGWFSLRDTALVLDGDPGEASQLPAEPAATAPRPDPSPRARPAEENTPIALPPRIRSTAEPQISHLRVSESGVGTGVVEHTLVGRSDRVPEGTKVWFWTRVVRGEGGEVLRHVWIYEGRTVAIAMLSVGGPHWRTHSQYTLPPGSAGSWAVEARGPDGRVLARQDFLCLPAQHLQTRR